MFGIKSEGDSYSWEILCCFFNILMVYANALIYEAGFWEQILLSQPCHSLLRVFDLLIK